MYTFERYSSNRYEYTDKKYLCKGTYKDALVVPKCGTSYFHTIINLNDILYRILSYTLENVHYFTGFGKTNRSFVNKINKYKLVSKKWKSKIDQHFGLYLKHLQKSPINNDIYKVDDFYSMLKKIRYINYLKDSYAMKGIKMTRFLEWHGFVALNLTRTRRCRYHYIFGNVYITFLYRKIKKKSKTRRKRFKNKATVQIGFSCTSNTPFVMNSEEIAGSFPVLKSWKQETGHNKGLKKVKDMSEWQKCIGMNLINGLLWFMMRNKITKRDENWYEK